MHINRRSKDILKVLELVSYSLTKGYIFRSTIAFKIDKIEKITVAIGIEGKQATLPKLSETHLDDNGSLQGRVRIPLIIRYSSMTS